MEECSEEKVVVVSTQKKESVYNYSCSDILCCKYSFNEIIRAMFFKCFGIESTEAAAGGGYQSCSNSDVKETTEDSSPYSTPADPAAPVSFPSATPQPTEDMATGFRPPRRGRPTTGGGPQTNSSGSS